MSTLNCWIDNAGRVRSVSTGGHATARRRGDTIRVSAPERRRTWLGIEVLGAASSTAKAACRRIVQDARRQGMDIRADIGGQVLEVMQHDRPTMLNKALA